jgi:hypothetical protein
MTQYIVETFKTLEAYGLTDALLPFLLIFTVIFAMLKKTRILGEGRKNFNMIVAMIFALMVVIPHITGSYPPGADIVAIMNSALPTVSLVVVAILMALLMIGLLGGETRWMGGSLSGIIALIAFGGIVYIFGGAAGWWQDFSLNLWGPDVTVLLIVILVFAIVIWFVTRDTEAEGAARAGAIGKNLLGDLGKMFGGGGGGEH